MFKGIYQSSERFSHFIYQSTIFWNYHRRHIFSTLQHDHIVGNHTFEAIYHLYHTELNYVKLVLLYWTLYKYVDLSSSSTFDAVLQLYSDEIESCCFNRLYSSGRSKTVPWFSLMHKEENELCIIYPLIYGSVL